MECKTINIVASSEAGGITDISARRLGQQIQDDNPKRTAIVFNNSTAAGHVAADTVAHGPACQYLLATSSRSVLPFMRPETAESVYGQLQPVGMVAKTPLVLAVLNDGPKTLDELVAQSKAAPKGAGLSYATGGMGSPSHLAAEILLNELGAPGTAIPFRGSGSATSALLGGHVQYLMTTPAAIQPYLDKVRILGVARDAPLPMPGLAEPVPPLKPGVKFNETWLAVYAGPNESKSNIAQMRATMDRLFANESFSNQFEKKFGMELGRGMSTEQFAAYAAGDEKDMKKVWEMMAARNP